MTRGGAIFLGVIAVILLPIVIFFDMIITGLGTQAFRNYSMVQLEVFLDDYGVPTDGVLRGYPQDAPSCFARMSYDAEVKPPPPKLACDDQTVVTGVAQIFDEQRLCNPIVEREVLFFRVPFTSQLVSYYYCAVGRNKAAELPAALAAARKLGREEFGQNFSPSYAYLKRSFEMLVYDGPDPIIDTVDCGDYSIMRTTTTVRNP